MFRLERWSVGALFGTWIAWWCALVGVSLGPGVIRAVRLARQPGNHGSFSASIDGGHLLFKVIDGVRPADTWKFGTSVGTALAWLAIPPLTLWVIWLISRPKRAAPAAPEAPLLVDRGTPVPAQQRSNAQHIERQW